MQLIERIGLWTWGLMLSTVAVSVVALLRRIRGLEHLSIIDESFQPELDSAKADLQQHLRVTVAVISAIICHGLLWYLCPAYPDWWRTVLAPLLLVLGGVAGTMALSCTLTLILLSQLSLGVSSALTGLVQWMAQRLFGVRF